MSKSIVIMKSICAFILLISLSMQSSIFVTADLDLAVDDSPETEDIHNVDTNVDISGTSSIINQENEEDTEEDTEENTDNNMEGNQPNLPEALVHAARVGAKMRAAQVVQNNSPDNHINNEDNEADDDHHSREPKPPLASGCFGTMGCKKVSPDKHIKIIEEEVSTTIHTENTDNETNLIKSM